MQKRFLKRADIILLAAILLLAGISAAVIMLFPKGNSVIIKQNNDVVFEGSISKDQTIKLAGNTVAVKNGYVYMENADCKNQICAHHKKISKSGENIICLPNRVIIEIK